MIVKKAKLTFLAATLLVVAMLLSSCGGGLQAAKPEEIFTGNYEPEAKIPTRVSDIGAQGAEVRDTNGKFVHLYVASSRGANNTDIPAKDMIYNMESDKMIYTFTWDDEKTYLQHIDFYQVEMYEAGLFTTTVRNFAEDGGNDTFVTTLYDENGTKIASVDRIEDVHTTAVDLFLFGGTCYRMAADKSYAPVSEWQELAGESVLDSIREMTDTYYYAYRTVNDKTQVTVYDKTLAYAASYRFPSYATVNAVGILADGKLLFQYTTALSDHAEKYDLLDENGAKHGLVTEILDVKANRTSQIKTDYIFDSMWSRAVAGEKEWFEAFTEKVNVVASVYEIKDQRVDSARRSVKYVILDENANAKASLTDMFPDMVQMVEPVAKDLYYYETHAGTAVLVKKDGTVLGDISGIRGGNNKYIFGESKLYNFDLTVAFDFSAQGLTYLSDGGVRNTATGVFFKKADGSIYYYTGSLKEVISKPQLDSKSIETITDEYYIVRYSENSSETSYTLYPADGQALITMNASIISVSDYNGVYLFRSVKNGETVYYRVAP